MNRRFNLVVAFILFGISASWAQNLWGTTSSGAADNKGVLYKTNSNGAFNAVMHNFVTDFPGASPQNSLTLAGGKLYGMTQSGGANNQGIIFEYDPVGNTYINKFDFSAATGTYPSGGLVLASNNKLYGMTTYGDGGSNDKGVLFEYVPGSISINVLFNFSTVDAANPYGSLIQASSNGKLYGMTSGGGSNGAGVIFEYDPIGLVYTKRVDFSGTAGARPGSAPYGNLVEASNSKLYGMTNTGGGSNLGVLFEYDPAIDTYFKMLDFTGSNGSMPRGSLYSASDGNLYGMTTAGGTNGLGILFQYNPGSTSVVKKIDFNGSNGAAPSGGGLFKASNGKLYGTTASGGANNVGTLFEYDIVASTLTDRVDFSTGSTGDNPKCSLVETNGLLYGMTPTGPGPSGNGTLFSFNTNGTFQTKLSFSNSIDGSAPLAGLVTAPNGMLYGMTSVGGANAQGVIYEFDPGGNVYTKKADFDFATTGANPVGGLVLGANNLLYGVGNRSRNSSNGSVETILVPG